VDVSVIVPVRNDADRLRRCLASVAKAAPPGRACEVIVADNGSTDASPAVAREAGARVADLPGLRVSALRNRAAALASGAHLAFIDADHEIDPAWIAAGLDALTDPGVGAAGALYLPPPRGTWVQRAYGALRGTTVGRRETDWLASGNLIVRRAAFDAIAGFDERLEACEDVDFCQRLRDAGWRLIADERLRSVHLGDPQTLGALFRAERWRGRNNIQVSLRTTRRWSQALGLVAPVLDLAALALIAFGLLSAPWIGSAGLVTAGAGAAGLLGLAGLRAARSLRREAAQPIGLGSLLLVVLVFNIARAAALVTRAPHHRRPVRPAAAGR
jgi:GT2 family glycosyltransferase